MRILPQNPWVSVKYYLALVLLLTFVNTATVTLRLSPTLKNDLAITAEELIQSFPQDLQLTVESNGITANKDFPLVAQTPSALKGLPKNLAVIDPNGEIGMLYKYDALILINNKYVIINNGDNVKTTPLQDFPKIQVDYAKMAGYSQNLMYLAKNVYVFTAVTFCLFNLFDLLVARVIYLLAFALGILLTYKSTVNTYAKALQLSIHSITLPLVISLVFSVFGIHVPIPAWFVLTHAVFSFYILSRLEKSDQN